MPNSPPTIALVSTPWPLLHRPSIQLGCLKSYIERESEATVDLYHPYLETAKRFSPEVYTDISLDGWGGETLFSSLLFDSQTKNCRKQYSRIRFRPKSKRHPAIDFDTAREILKQQYTRWVQRLPENRYLLFGFSVCFYQLLGSLYLAKLVKARFPDLPIVFGGSGCCGEVGRSLLERFPQIDFVVDGEGEVPLLSLVTHLVDGAALHPRITTRTSPSLDPAWSKTGQVNMDELPFPDYRPYFEELRQTMGIGAFFPQLPMEFSRGCWWNRCSFCNLNQQWQNYRQKSAARQAAEIDHQVQTHKVLDFCFTDNALPPRQAGKLFDRLGHDPRDFSFFAEIRCTSSLEELQRLKKGGLDTVQVGIESFSRSLLKKMRKGTSVMDNVLMMKLCAEADLRLEGNLILQFPGSTRKEVEETLVNLEFVLPFAPLEPARFFLGHDSPIQRTPADFQIIALTPHPRYVSLFPREILTSLTLPVHGFRGDQKNQQKIWKPVARHLSRWLEFHDKRRRATSSPAPLSHRDGRDFLIIRQEQLDGVVLQHRLKGVSRDIYLFCARPRTLQQIQERFPKISLEALEGFLQSMYDKRLMFREDDTLLSLSIPSQRKRVH